MHLRVCFRWFNIICQFLDNHWEGLTLFLRIPGVPISNNDNERQLKREVLNRKNAYFLKREAGARIADILLSVIETCVLNKVNPYTERISKVGFRLCQSPGIKRS